MDFEDEHYVRIFTRDTKTWLKWGWEGQAVFCLVDRKFDKAGVLDEIDDPDEDIALLTGLPVDVVRVGLARILQSGTFELRGTKLVCPNYIKANTSRKSDRLRASESRARRVAVARSGARRDDTEHGVTQSNEPNATEHRVTIRDNESRIVTDESRIVTENHEESHGVTFVSRKDTQTLVSAVHDHEQDTQHVTTAVSCPRDLTLTDDQLATLEAGGLMIPRWATKALTEDRVTVWVGDPNTKKTLVQWRKYLLGTVKRMWQDPKTRPKKPDPNATTPESIARAKARERAADERDEAERQARLARIVPTDVDPISALQGVF